jgi:hypothetical protein
MKKCENASAACKGTIKKRPVLRYNGRLLDETYDSAECDHHYGVKLRQAVARGKKAPELLAALR